MKSIFLCFSLVLVLFIAEHRTIAKTEVICRGKKKMLQCVDPEVINVGYSIFGRQEPNVCKRDDSTCFLNVTEKVRTECNCLSLCKVVSRPDWFGSNPCDPGIDIYVKVEYSCVPPMDECSISANNDVISSEVSIEMTTVLKVSTPQNATKSSSIAKSQTSTSTEALVTSAYLNSSKTSSISSVKSPPVVSTTQQPETMATGSYPGSSFAITTSAASTSMNTSSVNSTNSATSQTSHQRQYFLQMNVMACGVISLWHYYCLYL